MSPADLFTVPADEDLATWLADLAGPDDDPRAWDPRRANPYGSARRLVIYGGVE